jgi:hypothetical protein
MSHSFEHAGSTLPIAIPLGETSATKPCPTCTRAGGAGEVTLTVRDDAASGTTMATCSKGHMVMVAWTRDGAT